MSYKVVELIRLLNELIFSKASSFNLVFFFQFSLENSIVKMIEIRNQILLATVITTVNAFRGSYNEKNGKAFVCFYNCFLYYILGFIWPLGYPGP